MAYDPYTDIQSLKRKIEALEDRVADLETATFDDGEEYEEDEEEGEEGEEGEESRD